MIGNIRKMPEWLDVSRETLSRLESFCEIVTKWTPAVNLIAKSTVPDIWNRHILDSAQLFSLTPPQTRRWLDLGSGAGFPGLVIAILSKEHRPELLVTLVEADKRKAVFLAEAARTIGVAVAIDCARAESLQPKAADVISARALASLDILCGHAQRHLHTDGVAVFSKGSSAGVEIDVARQNWKFSLDVHASRTDPAASILLVSNIQNV